MLLYASFYFGLTVSGTVLSSGLEDFKGEKKTVAEAFRSHETWRRFSEGSAVYAVTVVRITEISGTIRVRTFFDSPYRKIEAECGGVIAG